MRLFLVNAISESLNPAPYRFVCRKSGGSFGDAFGRSHELQGEVSPKRGAAIDAQLEAEDQALLEQKRARKAEFEPREE